MLPYILTNFEIQKYYQNKPKFPCVYSRNNFRKIKGKAYVTNIDEQQSIGTHWIALYVNENNIVYFSSFRTGHIPKKIKKFIGNKNIITNIYIIQAWDSIMC